MVTLDNWRARMSEDMRLRDLRPRTHEAYLASVRQFMDRVGKAPEALTDEDVRGYFLYLREDRKLAPSSIQLAVHALRFFFLQTLRREWTVFELLRVRQSKRLPVVLARSEVRALLCAVRHPVRRMALATIYALGLRLGEGLRLEAGNVDAERLLVSVRDGKGAKDRSVPLPRPLLERLRSYWKHERPQSHSSYFFVPSEPFAPIELRRRGAPLSQSTFQMTFRAACRDARIRKPATIHTLRHSYGTHLLEAGISLRTIQHVLGHKSLRTTSVYMHVTTPGFDKLQETIDRLMTDL